MLSKFSPFLRFVSYKSWFLNQEQWIFKCSSGFTKIFVVFKNLQKLQYYLPIFLEKRKTVVFYKSLSNSQGLEVLDRKFKATMSVTFCIGVTGSI